MSKELLKKIRVYKDFLDGSSHTAFDGVMVCKVSGVTFDGRQDAVRKVTQDTPLKLERDRRNEHDFYAVKIKAHLDTEWKDVGFVPASINKDIASALDAGARLRVKVWKKVGGEGDFFHGLSVTIAKDN